MRNVHSIEEARTFRGRPMMTQAEIDADNEAKLKFGLAAEKREQRKRFSRGHIRNVVKHLSYIRICRDRCRVPRKVPKKVMETMFALSLR